MWDCPWPSSNPLLVPLQSTPLFFLFSLLFLLFCLDYVYVMFYRARYLLRGSFQPPFMGQCNFLKLHVLHLCFPYFLGGLDSLTLWGLTLLLLIFGWKNGCHLFFCGLVNSSEVIGAYCLPSMQDGSCFLYCSLIIGQCTVVLV